MKKVEIIDIHQNDFYFPWKNQLIGLTVFLVEEHAFQDQAGWWNCDIVFDRVVSDMGVQTMFFYGLKLKEVHK